MRITVVLLFLFSVKLLSFNVYGNLTVPATGIEEERGRDVADLLKLNFKSNGWFNIFSVGSLPDSFYIAIQQSQFTYAGSAVENEDIEFEDVVPYASNVIVMSINDFEYFEEALLKAQSSPYWHAQANIIIYYHDPRGDYMAKMFFIFWFYSSFNVAIIQYDDAHKTFTISHFTPYVSEQIEVQRFGCWKTTKVTIPVTTFEETFFCEQGCGNVSLNSLYRSKYLGTCIGVNTYTVRYGDREAMKKLNIFEDISKNLQGFTFRAYGINVVPFLVITETNNNSYTYDARDGLLWNTMATHMNFKFDLSVGKDRIDQPFNFEINLKNIFAFARREIDLLLIPIYLMDLIVVTVDFTIPYKDSGVCFVSHRAAFVTLVFDTNLLKENYMLLIQFNTCFVLIWSMFALFHYIENKEISANQFGIDFLNAVRSVLNISIPKQTSKRRSFRVFLGTVIWSFFAINFATQAAIMSIFAVSKRGKDVDTFEDVIAKDYPVEGIASPDMILPDDEERFLTINSKLVPTQDFHDCVFRMSNDSRRFCLVDCSVARYLERNRLDHRGQQFLHVANVDKIHNYYLALIFHKHSPLTKTINKYLRRFAEAGLVKKWEQYRYADIKEESQVKPLDLKELSTIFNFYFTFIAISMALFVLEILTVTMRKAVKCIKRKAKKWRRLRDAARKNRFEEKIR